MKTEEQLIHDILVLEERKDRLHGNTLKESLVELDKLSQRQLEVVKEYAKEQAVEYIEWYFKQFPLVTPMDKIYYDKFYDQFKRDNNQT
jgi:hypothetical protein